MNEHTLGLLAEVMEPLACNTSKLLFFGLMSANHRDTLHLPLWKNADTQILWCIDVEDYSAPFRRVKTMLLVFTVQRW